MDLIPAGQAGKSSVFRDTDDDDNCRTHSMLLSQSDCLNTIKLFFRKSRKCGLSVCFVLFPVRKHRVYYWVVTFPCTAKAMSRISRNTKTTRHNTHTCTHPCTHARHPLSKLVQLSLLALKLVFRWVFFCSSFNQRSYIFIEKSCPKVSFTFLWICCQLNS